MSLNTHEGVKAEAIAGASTNPDVVANTTHRSSDGKNHSDVVLNNAHRVIVTGNPHAVTKTEVGLANVTNDAQIPLTQKGAANGVGTLNGSGEQPTSEVPDNRLYRSVPFIIYEGGQVLSAGEKGDFTVEFNGTLVEAKILSKTSGSITIDILKGTYSGYPTQSSMVGAGTKPNLSTSQKYQDTTLTSWTTAVSKGDILTPEVEGTPATVTMVTLILVFKVS